MIKITMSLYNLAIKLETMHWIMIYGVTKYCESTMYITNIRIGEREMDRENIYEIGNSEMVIFFLI